MTRGSRGALIAAGAVGGGAALAAAFVAGSAVREAQPVPAITVTLPAAPVTATPSPDTAWSALADGDCLRDFASAWQEAYRVVPCAQPHAARVTALVPIEDGARPADEDLVGRLSLACADAPSGSAVAYTWPSAAEWGAGTRVAVCFAVQRAA